jgi:hypothetical protein
MTARIYGHQTVPPIWCSWPGLRGLRRLQLQLDPTQLSLIESGISFDRTGERLALRQNLHRIDRTRAHELHQVRHVTAVIAITHLQCEVLVHGLADRECARARGVDADDPDAADLGDALYGPYQRLRGRIAGAPIPVVIMLFRYQAAYFGRMTLKILPVWRGRAVVRMHRIHTDRIDDAVDANVAHV